MLKKLCCKLGMQKISKMDRDSKVHYLKPYCNIFSPKGKISGSGYFTGTILIWVYFFVLAGILYALDYIFKLNPTLLGALLCAIIIHAFLICYTFVLKQRLYDITNKPIFSWILAVVLSFISFICLASTLGKLYDLRCFNTLINIVMLFTSSKIVQKNNDDISNKKSNESLKKIKRLMTKIRDNILN